MSELNFGAKLTALRLEKGLTQEALAEALDISNKTVSKWETGFSTPDLEMLVRIAEYFEVSADHLLGIEKKEQIDIAKAIDREFDGLDRCSAVLKTFDLNNSIFLSAFGRMGDYSNERSVIPEVRHSMPRCVICNENMYNFMVNSEYLNLSCSLYKNKSDFAILEIDEALCRISELFAFLSDKVALGVCRLVHSESFPVSFTAKYTASLLNADEKRVTDILNKACSIGLCIKQTAHMKDGELDVYSSSGEGRILFLIALACEHTCGVSGNDYAFGGPAKLIGGTKK